MRTTMRGMPVLGVVSVIPSLITPFIRAYVDHLGLTGPLAALRADHVKSIQPLTYARSNLSVLIFNILTPPTLNYDHGKPAARTFARAAVVLGRSSGYGALTWDVFPTGRRHFLGLEAAAVSTGGEKRAGTPRPVILGPVKDQFSSCYRKKPEKRQFSGLSRGVDT